jgi:hypothetical protein
LASTAAIATARAISTQCHGSSAVPSRELQPISPPTRDDFDFRPRSAWGIGDEKTPWLGSFHAGVEPPRRPCPPPPHTSTRASV